MNPSAQNPAHKGNYRKGSIILVLLAVFGLLLYLVLNEDTNLKGEENRQSIQAKGKRTPFESAISTSGGGGAAGISGAGSTKTGPMPVFTGNPTNPAMIFLPTLITGNKGSNTGSAKDGNGTGSGGQGPPSAGIHTNVVTGPKIPRKPALVNRGQAGRAIALANGASQATFDAIDLGLAWLAEVQEPDGRWDARKWRGGNHDLGCTGLAVLAFLGDGNSHLEGKYRENVRRALDWMVARQQKDGHLGWTTFYEQGIAAMALCEDCSLAQDNRYYGAAINSIRHIIDKMGPDGGFGYQGPGNDTSVTGWQIMALKSALLADIRVPQNAIIREKAYLKKSINPDGSTGYRYSSGPRNSMTAIGMFCRIFLGYPISDPNIRKAAAILHKTGPVIKDEYGLYYATYCMFQWGGQAWITWNKKFRDPLIAKQVKSGPDKGSWGGAKHAGGRVYKTAMNIMSLEVYQRYLPVYR